jgi:hypothetical protein
VDLPFRLFLSVIHCLLSSHDWMKSQLIEVMNMKMQMIQFVPIGNLIQMKAMKMIYKVKNISNKALQL